MHDYVFSDNTVGFRLGSYKDGEISVIEPDDCVNIPQSMKHVAKVLISITLNFYQKV